MAKLHIPAPNQELDEAFGILELAVLVCAGLAAIIIYGFATQKPLEGAPSLDPEAAAVEQLSSEVKRQKKVAAEFDSKKSGELVKHAWTIEELLPVIRYGDRDTVEAACRARSEQIKAGMLSDPTLIELVKAVDRRAENAPYACLSRLHWAGEIKQKELAEEVAEFWKEAQDHEGHARLVVSTLAEFRETRQRPAAAEFYAWLRECAFDFEYEAASECQRVLNQISPAQGRDMLEAVEKHLDETKVSHESLTRIIRAIGRLARNGQPHATWKVVETKELPDYDVDFRQAAVFYLCRFVNSPKDDVAEVAAEELGHTGQYGARGFDAKLKSRWVAACRIAYKKTEEEDDPALQVLAVWDGTVESEPDYRLKQDIERGVCEVREGYPLWYCGSSRWNGEGKPIDVALQDFFVDTRHIETQDWD